mmetsp:Transcript_29259/g.57441  ORF Transcript_29259/g.57441 Transcript_29259/m.57441 type:complete len:845 (-) Transcript_29259:111-2645(-)
MLQKEKKRKRDQEKNPSANASLPVTEFKFFPQNVLSRRQGTGLAGGVLFEREHSFALLAPAPECWGHCILCLKHEVATLLEPVPAEAWTSFMIDLQVLCRAVQKATNSTGFQVKQQNGPSGGQTVPQLHFHVLPSFDPSPEERGEGGEETVIAVHEEEEHLKRGRLFASISNALPESYTDGFLLWLEDSSQTEELGQILEENFGHRGTAILLKGQLGAGKSTLARGFIRSFCDNGSLEVPSPSYLLCLSYQKDSGGVSPGGDVEMGDGGPSSSSSMDVSSPKSPRSSVLTAHHMDPFRLKNADKMAGLIDFDCALREHVCLIEWPDKMPTGVMEGISKGLSVSVSGIGTQGLGRLVCIESISEDFSSAKLRAWREKGAPPAPRRDLSGGRGQAGSAPPLSADAPSSSSGGVFSSDASFAVLGIESSCDDTAAAVVRSDGLILSHEIASQKGMHEEFGGVKPDVARQAHAAAIEGTVERCLQAAGVSEGRVALSAVGVTVGPGLSLCLQVGVRHALKTAARLQVPLVPVHHMEAHALVTSMPEVEVEGGPSQGGGPRREPVKFPALLLLVSGGHNMIVYSEGLGRHKVVGTTLDDSIGECFDKVARVMDIKEIPGGPALEKLAASGNPQNASLKAQITMPMQNGPSRLSCNFSFSGLKTSVASLLEKETEKLKRDMMGDGEGGETAEFSESLQRLRADAAAVFQSVSVAFLQQRTRRALEWVREDCRQEGKPFVNALVVAGGVAANKAVRAGLDAVAAEFSIPCLVPPIRLCTDNGVMVAWTALKRLQLGLSKPPPPQQSTDEDIDKLVEVFPRWPIGPCDPRSVVTTSGGKLAAAFTTGKLGLM